METMTMERRQDVPPSSPPLATAIGHRHVQLALRALLSRKLPELQEWWETQQWHDDKGQPMEDPLKTYVLIKERKAEQEKAGGGGLVRSGRQMEEFHIPDAQHLTHMSAEIGRALMYLVSFLRFPEDPKQPVNKLGTKECDQLAEFFTAIRDGDGGKVEGMLR